MVMMALLPPGGLLGGYAADPDGVNGSCDTGHKGLMPGVMSLGDGRAECSSRPQVDDAIPT